MSRILLIFGLMIVLTLQGISQGKISLSHAQQSPEINVEYAAANEGKTECCDGTRLIDSIPTFCKVDCKALMPLAEHRLATGSNTFELTLSDSPREFLQFVALRPPIS